MSKSSREAIHYRIQPHDLALHLFDITLTVAAPAADGQVLSLPAWIPGSYMIREFARNIVQIRAESLGKTVRLKKLDKHSWRAAPCAGPLVLQPHIKPSLPYKTADLVGICQTFVNNYALVASPNSKYRSVRDVIELKLGFGAVVLVARRGDPMPQLSARNLQEALAAERPTSDGIFAPNANSYRRFKANSYAPVAATWSGVTPGGMKIPRSIR